MSPCSRTRSTPYRRTRRRKKRAWRRWSPTKPQDRHPGTSARSAGSGAGASTGTGLLSLRGVTKRFGARVVLNAVSLEVAPGEYVAIIGESGIGKSTLLHVVAGLEPADSGSVVFDGAEITRMDDDSATLLRRDRFGLDRKSVV